MHFRRCKLCNLYRHGHRCLLKLLGTRTQHTVHSMHVTILCFVSARRSSPSNVNTTQATETARSPHHVHSLPTSKQQKSSPQTHIHTFVTTSRANAVCSLSRKPSKRFALASSRIAPQRHSRVAAAACNHHRRCTCNAPPQVTLRSSLSLPR